MTITDQINYWAPPLDYQTVTVSQLKKSLAYYNVIKTVYDAVSAEVTSGINIQWNNGLSFSVNDNLYNFIKTTLSYTDAQMATIMQYAASQQP